jgi:hypothetical protein
MVGKNYRLTADMKDAAAALNLPLASGALILRKIYADAPGQGSVVWNVGTRARIAAEEVQQIFREILPDAVVTRPARISMSQQTRGRWGTANRSPKDLSRTMRLPLTRSWNVSSHTAQSR